MALEIERKFLVDSQRLGALGDGEMICQGYIPTATKTAVRVRIKGANAYLTIKGENRGAVRAEFEYPIPLADAEIMLEQLCTGPKIEKTRYTLTLASHCWEIDIFHGNNEGLIVAEVELDNEHEALPLPPWVTAEVTDDPRYYNVNLLHHPFCDW
ncbi:CYTH domain-containing protein [Halioxenophilus sp. WMMB6]|uniref:CYTH domain-containing protein n=1 Tax=Halioxenophilus sp. WMMB6 TaxID=3073815 RepID=UPI00295E72E3|nr:CYTH domain-containing protein [Halioxenophilus sp. WMMB6]